MGKKHKRGKHDALKNQRIQQQSAHERYLHEKHLQQLNRISSQPQDQSSFEVTDTSPFYHAPNQSMRSYNTPSTVSALTILLFLHILQPAISAQVDGHYAGPHPGLGDAITPLDTAPLAVTPPMLPHIISAAVTSHHLRGTAAPLPQRRRATEKSESNPDITITDTGNTVIVCEIKNSDGKDEIYMKRPHQDDLLLSPAGVKCANPKVVALTDGQVKVSWAEKNTDTGYDIKGCIVNADFTINEHFTVANSTATEKNVATTPDRTVFEKGSACQVAETDTTIPPPCDDPGITTVNGLDVVAYDDGSGISVRTSSQNITDWQQLQISPNARHPSIAAATHSNNIAISYTEDDSIRLQIMRINADGSFSNRTTSAITSPASSRQSSPYTIALPNGFAVAYQTDENQLGLDSYIAFFDQNGNAVGAPSVIHENNSQNNQEDPRGVYGNGQVQLAYNNNGLIETSSVNVPAVLTQAPNPDTHTTTTGSGTSTTTESPTTPAVSGSSLSTTTESTTGSTTTSSGSDSGMSTSTGSTTTVPSSSPSSTTESPTTPAESGANNTNSSSPLDSQQSGASAQSINSKTPESDALQDTDAQEGISSDTILAIIAIMMVAGVSVYGAILCAGLYCGRPSEQTKTKPPAITEGEDEKKTGTEQIPPAVTKETTSTIAATHQQRRIDSDSDSDGSEYDETKSEQSSTSDTSSTCENPPEPTDHKEITIIVEHGDEEKAQVHTPLPHGLLEDVKTTEDTTPPQYGSSKDVETTEENSVQHRMARLSFAARGQTNPDVLRQHALFAQTIAEKRKEVAVEQKPHP